MYPTIRIKIAGVIWHLIALCLLSCGQTKTKVKTYRCDIPVEVTELTLYPQGEFELSINTDYFARTSKGSYRIVADTLVLNPSDKPINLIDSVVGVHDASVREEKVIELFKQNFVYGFGHPESQTLNRTSLYSDRLYLNKDTEPVEFRLDSTGFAFIADSIEVTQIRYQPVNDNTCQTQAVFTRTVTHPKANRIKVYLNDLESEPHYLQNWKWIIRGDTVFNYFTNGCEPNRRVFLQLARE